VEADPPRSATAEGGQLIMATAREKSKRKKYATAKEVREAIRAFERLCARLELENAEMRRKMR